MDEQYWLQRWREGRIGWHHDRPMPLLQQHWPALGVAPDTRVLVPLAGKSLDMLWLASQGLQVVGVEVSPVAVESFLAENHLRAGTHPIAEGTHYEVANAPDPGTIEIINGDMFAVSSASIAACSAFYDRAALIALPASMRERLAGEVYAKLPTGSRGLLITLEYPEGEMDGPPFSVDETEVRRLFAPGWTIEQRERRDILESQPHFAEKGVTALHTAVYALTRHAG